MTVIGDYLKKGLKWTLLILVILIALAYLRYHFEPINSFADRIGLSPILQGIEDTCNGFLAGIGIYPVNGGSLLTAGGITATGIGIVSKTVLPKLQAKIQAEQDQIRQGLSDAWSNSLARVEKVSEQGDQKLQTELDEIKNVVGGLQTQNTNLQNQLQQFISLQAEKEALQKEVEKLGDELKGAVQLTGDQQNVIDTLRERIT